MDGNGIEVLLSRRGFPVPSILWNRLGLHPGNTLPAIIHAAIGMVKSGSPLDRPLEEG